MTHAWLAQRQPVAPRRSDAHGERASHLNRALLAHSVELQPRPPHNRPTPNQQKHPFPPDANSCSYAPSPITFFPNNKQTSCIAGRLQLTIM